MTMNSSYVLIENASFLQGSERRYSHPIGCLVKHIILSWCSNSPIWNRSKQVAFKMRAQDCAGWYFPHLKCRKCLVVFTLHGGYSHLFRCIFIRRGRWFAYAFGFRLPYNGVTFAAEKKNPFSLVRPKWALAIMCGQCEYTYECAFWDVVFYDTFWSDAPLPVPTCGYVSTFLWKDSTLVSMLGAILRPAPGRRKPFSLLRPVRKRGFRKATVPIISMFPFPL